MPIAVWVDPTDGILFRKFTGAVTATEIRESWKSGVAQPAGGACYRQVSDIRDGAIEASGADLDGVSSRLIPRLAPGSYFTAIVALPGVQFGIARQVCALVEGHLSGPDVSVVTRAFTDYDEAIAWLKTTGAGPRADPRPAGPTRT